VSIRRACRVFELDTSTFHYRSCRPDQAAIKARIKEIAETRVRYGYRRVHVLLRREGWQVNHKRTYKLYKDLYHLALIRTHLPTGAGRWT
jgi:putative transposase